MFRFDKSLATLCVLASAASCVWAQEKAPSSVPAGMTRGASIEGISEYGLPNGLRVLLFPDPTKTSVTVNITYLVGSRNENYGETGMAHLLEHMLFKGSAGHRNVLQELTEHGARPNGSTWFDRTNYFETFQASDLNLDWALNLEADRMVNSFIAKSDLDNEMTVVRNEFERGENSPLNVLEERVLSTAYLWHNYGKSTIGARSDIEHVPIGRLQDFYHRYYQPDNAVLTIAGGLNEAKTLALVKQYFGQIPKPSRILLPTYTEEPVQDGERTVTLRREGDQKVVILGVHVPSLAQADGAMVPILADVLTSAPSGRLYKALVETRKAGMVNRQTFDTREPGMMLLFAAAPSSADLPALESLFLATVNETISRPPTEEEVARSKTRILSQFDLLVRDSEQLGLLLSESIGAGDWRLAFVQRDREAAATTADIARLARTYLTESNRTLGLFIPTEKPERAAIPAAPDIASIVNNYKGGAAVEMGEAFDPSPANIDRHTVRGELKPGIKLAIVSKKTRGGVVHASMRLHFGDEKSLQGKEEIAGFTGDMLMRGSKRYTREQITDRLNQLKAQVRISGSATGAFVNIQTTRENFAAVMELVMEVLREPVFPKGEFEALKQQELTMLESQRKEPQALAFIAAQRHVQPYPKGDVRHTQSIEEEMEAANAVTLDDVQQFYKAFYGASHAELSAVGDLDAEKLEKQLSSGLGGWTSATQYTRVPTPFQNVPAVKQTIETPDKANATWVAVGAVKLNDDNPDYPALTMANYMMGGGFLNSRLATRIRVKDGLSYGVGSMLRVPTADDSGVFMANAIAAPQNVARVESDFDEELRAALKTGFGAKELEAAKSGWLQSRQVSRGQDSELAMRLTSQAFWNRTMAWDARLDEAVKALTPEQVNAALRKYVSPDTISTFKAGDFAKGASAPATTR